MQKLLASMMITAGLWLVSPLPHHASAAPSAGFELFYSSLSPYGEWIDVGDYGSCWHPVGLDSDWRPYTQGRWVYTDAGWTWNSAEPFGWAVFHYGRWFYVSDLGWCWMPDTEWAPAWVSFRYDSRFIGWAPLPPEARLRGSIDFGTWVDAYYDIGPSRYCFVPFAQFGAPVVRTVILRPERNFDLFASTVNVTSINRRENITFVGGFDFDAVAAKSETPLKRLRLHRQTDVVSANELQGKTATIEDGKLNIPAPKISAATDAASPPPQGVKKVAMSKVERGWEHAGDPAKVQEMKAKLKAESKVPSSLPPQPVIDKKQQASSTQKQPGDAPPTPRPKKEKEKGEVSTRILESQGNPKVLPGEPKTLPTLPGDAGRLPSEKGRAVIPRTTPAPPGTTGQEGIPKPVTPDERLVPKTDAPPVTPPIVVPTPGAVPRGDATGPMKKRTQPQVTTPAPVAPVHTEENRRIRENPQERVIPKTGVPPVTPQRVAPPSGAPRGEGLGTLKKREEPRVDPPTVVPPVQPEAEKKKLKKPQADEPGIPK